VLGQALGLTDAEFTALQSDDAGGPIFDARERAVLRWAEALTRNTARYDEAAWGEMRRHFSDAEIVEISMASALFNMINRLNDAFRTQLEPEEYNRRQHGAVGVTTRALDEYACRICAAAGTPGREGT
jgi:hypothetical protein